MVDEQDITWSYLQEIGEAERHFNGIESTYRALASTGLLASFAGMGFVLETSEFPVQKGIVIFAIAFAGSLGVQLIWIIDMLVYHRILDAYFLEGLRIEASNPEIPQTRWNMLAAVDEQKPVDRQIRLFYTGCSLILLPFGIVSVLTFYSTTEPLVYLGLLSAIIPIMTAGMLWRKSRNKWLLTEIEKLNEDRTEP